MGFYGAWVGGCAILLWLAARLRTVWLEEDHLIVAGFGWEKTFPLHLVASVTQNRWWHPTLITIRFRPLPGLPGQVVFLTAEGFSGLFSGLFTDHPVVQKLRARVEEASSGRSPSPF